MQQIHIRDNNFFSEKYPERSSPYFEWIWDRSPVKSYLTVFTDNYLKEAPNIQSQHKAAWLIEPPSISGHIYQWVRNNHQHFEKIFTFSENLLSISPVFKYVPYGTTWIREDERKIYNKTKNVSLIASAKNLTEGHKLRHECARAHGSRMTLMGGGYHAFKNKVDGLKDFRYSVVIENSRINSYFSEKLLDCLLTGTIPIYWGFPKAKELFDPDGFLFFSNAGELGSVLEKATLQEYEKKKTAIQNNFIKAQEYICIEKHLWHNGLKDFFN